MTGLRLAPVKTQSKNFLPLHPSRWRFLSRFLTASKSSRRSIIAAKREEKDKKASKNFKNLSNFDFCAHPSQNVEKHDASGKKGKLSCRK